MDKCKAYCNRIQIISLKENFFNLPNHGYVELFKDVNSYKLLLYSENGLKKIDFEVIIFLFIIYYNEVGFLFRDRVPSSALMCQRSITFLAFYCVLLCY